MKMEFSAAMGRKLRIHEVASHAGAAEDSGFSSVTFLDSQNMSRDVYVMMTIAALNTRRIHIGQGVTVPYTRHPSVTANATATVNELSGGRVFLGIGAGGSAFWTMGKNTGALQEVREAVEFIRSYMAGDESQYKGAKMHSEWVGKPVPIYMAADGPRSVELAGEIADGVIFVGAHPEYVKWRMELIEKGALKAKRDLSKIDIWVRTLVYVGEANGLARRDICAYPAMYGNIYNALRQDSPQTADLRRRLERSSPGLLEGLLTDSKRVLNLWAPYLECDRDAPWTTHVTQRLIDFFNLTGKPEDICERIDRLGGLGVKTVSAALYTITDSMGMMREIGDKIMPRFRN